VNLAVVLEFFKMLFKALRAEDNPDPKVQYAWRRAVSMSLFAIIGSLIFSYLWAHGDIPGLSGVALAKDLTKAKTQITATVNSRLDLLETRVKRVEDGQKQMQINQVESSLEDQYKTRCTAVQRNNQQALNDANERIESLHEQYYDLLGYQKSDPSCETILIAPK
jgi:hypothetical protein